MRILCLLAPALAALALAACGGEDPAPASNGTSDRPTVDEKTKQAMLDFARCMRANGVDMADPQFESGGRVLQRGPQKVDRDKLRTAEKACAKYRDAVKPPELSDTEKAEMRKAALAHARCMREHGVDFPDPQFDENGGAEVHLGRGLDPSSAKFREADKACRDKLPFGRDDVEDER